MITTFRGGESHFVAFFFFFFLFFLSLVFLSFFFVFSFALDTLLDTGGVYECVFRVATEPRTSESEEVSKEKGK